MTTHKNRARGALPANWQFRDGRPRWIPGPGLRNAGWKGRNLKATGGAFLTEGASIDMARSINEAVAAWRAGQLAPPDYADIAPAGACFQGGLGAPPPQDKLAIGRLIDAFTGTWDGRVKPSEEFAQLKPATQRDYRNKLKRLVDVLAGHLDLPADGDVKALKAYNDDVAQLRAASVLVLEPVETAKGIEDPLHAVYWQLHREVGLHQASGVLTVASLWLKWCRARQSRKVINWAADVKRDTPPGRIRPGSWAEIDAMMEAAERLGWLSIADSIVLGLDLSWSQIDRLALTWPRAGRGRCLTGPEGRQKTGRVGGTPLSEIGRRRLAQIIWRQRRMAAQPTHVLWCETTSAPWKADHYRHTWADVRDEAAKACPSVATLTDADLRDTAVTLFGNAGLSTDQIASRTLQSRKTIDQLRDRHYGEIGPEIADQGVALLDKYLKGRKVGK